MAKTEVAFKLDENRSYTVVKIEKPGMKPEYTTTLSKQGDEPVIINSKNEKIYKDAVDLHFQIKF